MVQVKTRGIRPRLKVVVKSNSSSLSHNDAKRVLSNFVRVYGVLGEQLVLPTVGDSLVNGRLRSGWTVGATWRTNYSPPGLMAPLVQPLDRALPRPEAFDVWLAHGTFHSPEVMAPSVNVWGKGGGVQVREIDHRHPSPQPAAHALPSSL
ncbi:hypothetical protein BJV77DRAFT_962708 [Russula vinacea]|nr:hypothetical protein BJV77DRAFT_962708 [Russula vinacea]